MLSRICVFVVVQIGLLAFAQTWTPIEPTPEVLGGHPAETPRAIPTEQPPVVLPEVKKPSVGDKLRSELLESRLHRAETKWAVLGSYSLFDMWILNRYGLTGTYHSEPSLSYELEYVTGSIGFSALGLDIGKISEQRLSLLRRSYNTRNTFNFITGIFYNKFDVRVGDDLLASVSGEDRVSAELIELSTLGVTWGLGNRWQTTKGFVFGADWFLIHIPLVKLSEKNAFARESNDSNDKDDVETALKLFRNIPALVLLKLQVGYSF